jgi:hypothetical protein
VKTYLRVSFIIIPLLFACAPKKPEIPMTEVPAGPLLRALEQRQHSFQGLKALASVQIQRLGNKRTLESVGIVLDGQRRLRMEAYGPLGQSIMALVWDGKDILLRRPGSDKVERQGREGIAELLGKGLDVRELCASLSGNIPELAQPYTASQFCSPGNNDCVLEIHQGSGVRRMQIVNSPSGSGGEPRLISQELYRSGKLLYQVRFDQVEDISQYRLPMKIEIENPDHSLLLTIEYTSEIGVNAPVNDEAFVLSDEDRGK